MSVVYKDGLLLGKACVSARYLGGWRHFKESNYMEIGFYAMGKIWPRNSGRATNMVFSAMMGNAVLSGLELGSY